MKTLAQEQADRITHGNIARVRALLNAETNEGKRVGLGSSKSLDYDRLVVAPGIRFLWDRLEGYGEAQSQRLPHAWRAGAQTDLLAAQLRAMEDGGVFAICVP